jgi:hypothetical protein
MSLETFNAALNLVQDYGSTLFIGGGEPTVHPDFWTFIGMALSKNLEGPPWLATNGKRTEDALALARLAKKGSLAVALSIDQWHSPIDPTVIDAFTRRKPVPYGGSDYRESGSDYREIRSIMEPFKAGRWKDGPQECVCEDICVEPDGTIKQCGCKNSPVIGHVSTGFKNSQVVIDGGCYRGLKRLPSYT